MIVTYEEAAEFLGDVTIANTAMHKMNVNAADAFVKRYCGRPFERGTYTEILPASGGTIVYLNEENVTSIVEVYSDEMGEFADYTEILDLSSVHAEGNRLVFENGYWPKGQAVVKVTYVGGYWPANDVDPLHVPKMPDDLRFAVLRMVMTNQMRASREFYQSESVGNFSYSRTSGRVPANATGYDDAIIEVLDSYKRW